MAVDGRLVAAVSTLVVGVVVGCSAGAPSGGGRAAGGEASASFAHVHGISADGPALLLATHEGLFRQVAQGQPVRISDQPFDVMGFTPAEGRLLSSGHPAPGTDQPDDLGLGQSTDGGRTWTPVSLLGKVDFHRLASRGRQIWGISAGDDSLLTSTDGGRSWTNLGQPGLFDLAVDPADPTRVVGTTEAGPVFSNDGGRSFSRLADAPCSSWWLGARRGCSL